MSLINLLLKFNLNMIFIFLIFDFNSKLKIYPVNRTDGAFIPYFIHILFCLKTLRMHIHTIFKDVESLRCHNW